LLASGLKDFQTHTSGIKRECHGRVFRSGDASDKPRVLLAEVRAKAGGRRVLVGAQIEKKKLDNKFIFYY
jgi:hypothetical protein